MTDIIRDYLAIKHISENRIGSYGLLWGNEWTRDLYGEYFDPDSTQELTTIFEAIGKLPGLYDHGLNKALKSTVTGVIDVIKRDNKGLWVEEQLNLHGDYLEEVMELVEQGKLFWSSGALPAAYESDWMTGKIKRWPIIEFSKTVRPAEWRMVFNPIQQMTKSFHFIGVEIDPEALVKAFKLSNNTDDLDQEGEQEGNSAPEDQDTATLLEQHKGLLELAELEADLVLSEYQEYNEE